jgi:hypothetical protein
MHSVRTNLAKGDIARAVLARLTRPGPLLKAWAVWTLVVAALLSFLRGTPQDTIDILVLAISASVGAVISVTLAIAFTVLRVQRTLKPGDGVLGEHIYEVREDGLYERTSVNETMANWPGVKGVVESKTFAFIEMRSGSFHIIPRHAFSSAEHWSGFTSEIRRRATNGA